MRVLHIDINPEVREWKIPQMIIHTIIENEYKYAVNINQMLTILIKAYKSGCKWRGDALC